MREATRHWSDDDLLRKVYGLGLDNAAAETHLEAHLEECAECGARWRQLLDRRADALSAASAESVSDERLQRQRAAVWERIERRPGFWTWKWVPAAAAVCVLAVGIVLLHPPGVTPTPRPLTAQSSPAPLSDAQLFNDVAALSVPEAPRGAAPIEGLFEQQRDTEDEEAIF